MPLPIQILLLAVLGAVTGALINWAIYQWAIFQHRPISPFMKPRPEKLIEPEDIEKLRGLETRTFLDRIPILGWFRLRRDAEILGKWAWVRPLLIEIAWAIGLPLFFIWQHQGGLIGHDPNTVAVPLGSTFASLATTWFWLQAILIALMFIATFIDFDEQMIPDQVTVPGTIIALIAAAVWPLSRLPISTPGRGFDFIDFGSPNPLAGWHLGFVGLATCLAILAVWIWGLLPKIVPSRDFKLGIAGSTKIMLASILRCPRKNDCEIRVEKRRMFGMTKLYLLLLVVGAALLLGFWGTLGDPQKDSLVSAFIGLGVAGGLIWGIRIVGGLALGQQAMGFGDVTLMCMIGAFLGWQASIAGFVYSIMFALVLAIILFVITRKSYLAFGPYLCMGALLALIRWPTVWAGFEPIFWMGPLLLAFFGGSLVLMAVLLPLIRWLKESTLGPEE